MTATHDTDTSTPACAPGTAVARTEGGSGPITRARAGVAALEVLDELRTQRRAPTDDERDTLHRWPGWGPLANAFEPTRTGAWAQIGERVEWLLRPEEVIEARKATPNAFYTPPVVAGVCWQIMRDLGFAGGKILEPGCGAGVFMGHTPPDLADTVSWLGVERDPSTAGIAAAIYPTAEVITSQLEQAKLPIASVDAVLGNVPFANTRIFDPSAPAEVTSNLHNYCIWRSVQTLRPGGVAVLITSRYTLDSAGSSARSALHETCDLLGAIRLPNVAWRSGGTEPVADILVLRRRRPDETRGDDGWLDALNDSELSTTINSLWRRRPDLVVGTHSADHAAQYGRVLKVDGPTDVDWVEALCAAADRVSVDAVAAGLGWHVDPAPGPISADNTVLTDAEGRKEGSFHLIDGQAFEVHEAALRPVTRRQKAAGGTHADVPVKGKELAELTVLVQLRDTTLAVLDAESRAVVEEHAKHVASDIDSTSSRELARHEATLTATMATAPNPDGQPWDLPAMLRHAQRRTWRPSDGDTEAQRAADNDPVTAAYHAARGWKVADQTGATARSDRDAAAERLEEISVELADLRAELNSGYDSYRGTYGFLNRCTVVEGAPDEDTGIATVQRRRPRMGGFRTDPDYFAVLALEDWDDDAHTATKAAIFTRRVNRVPHRQDRADSAGEAIALCLDEHGTLYLPTIARLLDIDETAVPDTLGDLAYVDPATNDWVAAEEYLSGNVRVKLDDAVAAAVVDPDRWQRNVTALRAVQPTDLGPGEVHAPLGAPWIPASDVADFLTDLLDTRRDLTVRREPLTSTWEVKVDRRDKSSPIATAEWGTEDVPAGRLVELALNGQTPDVTRLVAYPDGDRLVRDVEATTAAEDKQRQIMARFLEWVWEDPQRADRLAERYNRLFNATVVRRYDGSHLTFPGLADGFDPYPHQRDMVYRAMSTQTALCGHAVGGGKTTIMFMTAMKLRQLGLVTKPMIVVPKHLLEQTAREGKQRFPAAKILVADDNDMSSARARKMFAARCATGDWDAVIVTHPAFTRIPVHERTEAEYLAETAVRYRESLAAIHAADGDADRPAKPSRRTKQIEKMIDSLESRAKYLLHHPHDDGVRFEHLGVDHLLVDEFHYFKNLMVPCHTEGFSMSNSKRATDMHMKLTWLRSRYDRVGTFYTGTAVSNSLLELYVVMHYLMPERLAELGVESPDAWAAWCVQFETNVEIGPDGVTPRLHRRPSTFKNVPELLQLFAERSDIRTQKELGLQVPEVVHENVVSTASPLQRAFIADLARRAEACRGTRTEPGGDNMLKICTDGRKVAADPELVGLDDPAPGKPDDVIARAAAIYHRTANLQFPADAKHAADTDTGVRGALQILFCDLGTPNPDRGDQVYGKIRDGLVEQCVPRDRIRFIHHAKTDTQKAALFADCRTGKVSILLGSTDKLGVGTNVQSRVVALHHVDAPWRPADVEQREGRGRRPGNRLLALQQDRRHRIAAGEPSPDDWPTHLTIFRYVTEGSFDGYMWQGLERKARFISQVLSGRIAPGQREIDDIGQVTLSFAEVKALATGNPLLMEAAKAKADVARLSSLAAAHTRTQRRMDNAIDRDRAAARDDHALATILDAIDKAGNPPPASDQAPNLPGAARPDGWTTRTGRVLTDNADIDTELAAMAGRAVIAKGRTYEAIRVRGLQVEFDFRDEGWRKQVLFAVLRSNYQRAEHSVEVGSHWQAKGQHYRYRQAITDAVATASTRAATLREHIVELQDRITASQAQLGKPFPQAAEFAAARDRLDEIDTELREAAVQAQNPPTDTPTEVGPVDDTADADSASETVTDLTSATSEPDVSPWHAEPQRSIAPAPSDTDQRPTIDAFGLPDAQRRWLHRRLVELARGVDIRHAVRTVPEAAARFCHDGIDRAMVITARTDPANGEDDLAAPRELARRFLSDPTFADPFRRACVDQVRVLVERDLAGALPQQLTNLATDHDITLADEDMQWLVRWITNAAADRRISLVARANTEDMLLVVLRDHLLTTAAEVVGEADSPPDSTVDLIFGADHDVANRLFDIARSVVYDTANQQGHDHVAETSPHTAPDAALDDDPVAIGDRESTDDQSAGHDTVVDKVSTAAVEAGDPALITADHELDRYARINAAAAAWFVDQLASSPAGIQYLRDRLGGQAAADKAAAVLTIGYAPKGWTGLVRHLRDQGFADRDLVDVGVASVVRSGPRTGQLIDFFRDRIMFAVRDHDGRVAGFTGRTLTETDPRNVKYLNTRSTPLFDKGRLVLGLWEQREHSQNAVPTFAEGPFDIAAIIAAMPPQHPLMPVAACGTALTARHFDAVDAVVPLERRRVLALDGNAAGHMAALAVADTVIHRYTDLAITSVPNGTDPAQYRAEVTAQDFLATFTTTPHTRPAIEVLIDHRLQEWNDQLQWSEGRIGAARHVAGLLAPLEPRAAAEHALRIANRLGIDPPVMVDLILAARSTTPADPLLTPPALSPQPPVHDRVAQQDHRASVEGSDQVADAPRSVSSDGTVAEPTPSPAISTAPNGQRRADRDSPAISRERDVVAAQPPSDVSVLITGTTETTPSNVDISHPLPTSDDPRPTRGAGPIPDSPLARASAPVEPEAPQPPAGPGPSPSIPDVDTAPVAGEVSWSEPPQAADVTSTGALSTWIQGAMRQLRQPPEGADPHAAHLALAVAGDAVATPARFTAEEVARRIVGISAVAGRAAEHLGDLADQINAALPAARPATTELGEFADRRSLTEHLQAIARTVVTLLADPAAAHGARVAALFDSLSAAELHAARTGVRAGDTTPVEELFGPRSRRGRLLDSTALDALRDVFTAQATRTAFDPIVRGQQLIDNGHGVDVAIAVQALATQGRKRASQADQTGRALRAASFATVSDHLDAIAGSMATAGRFALPDALGEHSPRPSQSPEDRGSSAELADATDYTVTADPLQPADIAVFLHRLEPWYLDSLLLSEPVDVTYSGYINWRKEDQPDAGASERASYTKRGMELEVAGAGFTRGGRMTWAQVRRWLDVPGIDGHKLVYLRAAETARDFRKAVNGFVLQGEGDLHVAAVAELDACRRDSALQLVLTARTAHENGVAPAKTRRRSTKADADGLLSADDLTTLTTAQQETVVRIDALRAVLPAGVIQTKPVQEVQAGDILDRYMWSKMFAVTQPPQVHDEQIDLIGDVIGAGEAEHGVTWTFHTDTHPDRRVRLVPRPQSLVGLIDIAPATPILELDRAAPATQSPTTPDVAEPPTASTMAAAVAEVLVVPDDLLPSEWGWRRAGLTYDPVDGPVEQWVRDEVMLTLRWRSTDDNLVLNTAVRLGDEQVTLRSIDDLRAIITADPPQSRDTPQSPSGQNTDANEAIEDADPFVEPAGVPTPVPTTTGTQPTLWDAISAPASPSPPTTVPVPGKQEEPRADHDPLRSSAEAADESSPIAAPADIDQPALDREAGEHPADAQQADAPQAGERAEEHPSWVAAGVVDGSEWVADVDPTAHQWAALVRLAAERGFTVQTAFAGESHVDKIGGVVFIRCDQLPRNRLADLAIKLVEIAVDYTPIEIPRQRRPDPMFSSHSGELDLSELDRPGVGHFAGTLSLTEAQATPTTTTDRPSHTTRATAPPGGHVDLVRSPSSAPLAGSPTSYSAAGHLGPSTDRSALATGPPRTVTETPVSARPRTGR